MSIGTTLLNPHSDNAAQGQGQDGLTLPPLRRIELGDEEQGKSDASGSESGSDADKADAGGVEKAVAI
jgi:hypothetical protein